MTESNTSSAEDKDVWSCNQIEAYRNIYPRYQQYGLVLRQVLEKAARQLAPFAVVQTRPKAIASFAEKIQRKRAKYRDPVKQITDLCGGRVITHTHSEVKAVCEFIEQHFEIDWENSVDVSQRLKPAEFGYRSVHYIVRFKPGIFPTQAVAVEIPPEVFGLKAEIQVRTLLEHAWAGFSHDRVYKGEFTIPAAWQRELAGLAALLEQADEAFSRVEQGLRTYAAAYGAYLTEDQMAAEMALLETVLACDPDNADLAYRIGKLAMTLGDWGKAIAVFERYVESGYQPIARDLGVALCKVHNRDPYGAAYRRGQAYLEQASAAPNRDPDALASLAGTWKGINEDKVRELYRQAFEVDPTDPYAVSNYLVYEIAYRRDTSPVSLMTPAIRGAMRRCLDQAEVGMNLPWAYYNLGIFYMVLGEPYESLAAYAKAIELSADSWFLVTSLRTLRRLEAVRDRLTAYEWAQRLLLVALAGKHGEAGYQQEITQVATPGVQPFSGPILVVAGACDSAVEAQMQGYRPLLVDGLAAFRGDLISGGSTAGISGLTGEVQAAHGDHIRTVGYLPALIPSDVVVDTRYRELRRTAGHGFSALEPLQYWTDIVASRVPLNQVKMLGIHGGKIAAIEYRMALALGARVGVVQGSGRATAQLLADEAWRGSPLLTVLPDNPADVQEFVSQPGAPADR